MQSSSQIPVELLIRRPAWRIVSTPVVFALVACCIAAFERSAPGQGLGAEDIKVQLEHYPPPNETKLKTLLEAATARPEGRLTEFTRAKLTMFSTNGAVEIIATTPECVSDGDRKTVSSSKQFQARSGDGNFLLEGEGFLLEQTNSTFWVSNGVHTVSSNGVPAGAIGVSTNPPGDLSLKGPIEVFSHTLFFNRDDGVAWYRGSVRVVATNMHMTTESLRLDLLPDSSSLKTITAEEDVVIDNGAIHAVSRKAVYDAASDAMVLTGAPSWSMGQREGRGDELVLNRADGVFRANGHGFLKLPASSNPTNFFAGAEAASANAGSTNNFLEIRSGSYELRTNVAVFRDGVEAVKFTNTQPAGKITCGLMTIHYADSNHVQDAVAEQSVLVEQNDGFILANRAFFSAENSTVEFTGTPSWKSGAREGSGDRLIVNTAKNEMQAVGHAKVKLPASESGMGALTTGSTNFTAPETNQFVEISCDEYTLSPQSGAFQGLVRVKSPQFDLASGLLKISASGTNGQQSARVEATQNVAASFIMNDAPAHATSGRLVYTYDVKNGATNELVTLSENATVTNADGTMTGEPIILDRRKNEVRGSNVKLIPTKEALNSLGEAEHSKTNSPANK